MSSLYKRANPTQRKMLKIIEGAVLHAHNVHPVGSIEIERFARSVAKRAVGTLSAQMQDRFAEGHSSVTEGGVLGKQSPSVVG